MSKNNKSLIKATRKRIAKQRPNIKYNTKYIVYGTNAYSQTFSTTLADVEHCPDCWCIRTCGRKKNDVNISRGTHKIHHIYPVHIRDTYDTNDDWCVLLCTSLPRSLSCTHTVVVGVEQIGYNFQRMFYHFHVLKTTLFAFSSSILDTLVAFFSRFSSSCFHSFFITVQTVCVVFFLFTSFSLCLFSISKDSLCYHVSQTTAPLYICSRTLTVSKPLW